MFVVPVHKIEDGDYTIGHQMLFQTPLFDINIKDIDNRKLENDLYDLKNKDIDGGRYSNIGGWHSKPINSDNIKSKEDIDKLKIFTPIIEKLPKILPRLPFDPIITNIENIGIWANISSKGNFNTRHSHPECDISGVYYVKIPEEKSGEICFYDPRQSLSFGNRLVVNRYVGGNSTFRYPKEGLMFLFPSSFEHMVKPNETSEDRISISFNLNLR